MCPVVIEDGHEDHEAKEEEDDDDDDGFVKPLELYIATHIHVLVARLFIPTGPVPPNAVGVRPPLAMILRELAVGGMKES